MLISTTWKTRPLSKAQTATMMERWAKVEAATAADSSSERVSFYMNADGSGGSTVVRVKDEGAAAAHGLEMALAMWEFIETESKVVLELDDALPAIMRAVERINAD